MAEGIAPRSECWHLDDFHCNPWAAGVIVLLLFSERKTGAILVAGEAGAVNTSPFPGYRSISILNLVGFLLIKTRKTISNRRVIADPPFHSVDLQTPFFTRGLAF